MIILFHKLLRSALAIVFTFVFLLLVPPHTIQAETHQTVPSANFSFMSDLQNFLRVEDANRYSDFYSSAVISGGIHSTAAGLVGSPSAMTAYVGGFYITESGTITYPDASTCHVIAHKDLTANQGSYTRVAGTHYLINCASVTPPAIPNNQSVLLMTVTTSGGAITAVTDRRPLGHQLGFDACRYTTLDDAVAALGTTQTPLVVGCFLRATTNITIPVTSPLLILNSGEVCPDVSTTLTINAVIHAADQKIFCSGAGAIVIGRGSNATMPVEWWGNVADDATDNTSALQFAADSVTIGATLRFHCGRYKYSGNVTFLSRINLIGSGIECTELINTSTTGTNLLTLSDTTTGNDELRYSRVFNLSLVGNSLSGHGLVINNPYHVYVSWVRVNDHGNIGINIEKGFGGSTYGQNVFIDHVWVRSNRGGGIRFNRPAGSSGADIIEIRNSSINQNAYYGVYLSGVSMGVIAGSEFADYYYESVLSSHQAVPIAIAGGAAIDIANNSFENNGGNGATATNHIKLGWDGDAQVDSSTLSVSYTQTVGIHGNDFKADTGQPGTGAINHIRLLNVLNANVYNNFFEKSAGYANLVYGIEWSAATLTYGQISIHDNLWHTTIDGQTTGAYYGNYLWSDVVPSTFPASSVLGYGIHSSAATDVSIWQRRSTDSDDNFQVLGDGSMIRGLGAAAPTVKFLIGAGSPEGAVTAGIGSIYQRTDGGANTSLYVKESGTGNTGWVAK